MGICGLSLSRRIDPDDVMRMMGVVRHRGPDETGVYVDDGVGLGHVRLSIIDLDCGCQPIHNEDETLWIVYNGEVFNYVELREDLERRGHRFCTTSDTEVVLHLYEDEGAACLRRLNGQFALAIWDSKRTELFLARDRVGIRPLHYTVHDGAFIFGSEIKSIFAVPGVTREIDPASLDQIFTFWTVLPGRTAFVGIHELPPGHYLRVSHGRVSTHRYWEVPVCTRDGQLSLSPDAICERIRELLLDAIRIRLRADVPVGCYLSGGLDSSSVATLVATRFDANVQTFGIRFDQGAFDEGEHQTTMASFLGTDHHELQASGEAIGGAFAQALWHCEKPLLRTAPVPLFMLSNVVNRHGLKVVLTGEGADEVFGGYNIFKEAKFRRFWARQPDSSARAALLGNLYGYVFRDERSRRLVQPFFAKGLDRADDDLFSHALRWSNTSRAKTFFSRDLSSAMGDGDCTEQVADFLPAKYRELDIVAKAQYLETVIFLSNYLLSSQGDRVAMAHSVEIRLPFLDYRLIEFMAQVPSRWKLLGLNEKYILKKALRAVLPASIVARRKQPYRAPIAGCLLHGRGRDLAMDMLATRSVKRAGLFDAAKVERLVAKMEKTQSGGEIDSMALAGVLSSQIIHHQYVRSFPRCEAPAGLPDRFIDNRTSIQSRASA
jgi:asparagine synthase (glutamine-hydrolysing)